MQLVYGLHFGAWLLLWLSLFAAVKHVWPQSLVGETLAVLTA